MFFMGANFESSVICTLKSKQIIIPLLFAVDSIRRNKDEYKNLKTFSENLGFSNPEPLTEHIVIIAVDNDGELELFRASQQSVEHRQHA